MVAKSNKKLGSRPVLKEDLETYINRELNPLVEALRARVDSILERLVEGNGSPEGVVTADKGAIYMRQDGGPGTSLYAKTTDNAPTGWLPFA